MTEKSLLGRARLSCVPCRTRKSKCDEQIPCSSCVIRGCSDDCHLPTSSSPSVSRSKASAKQNGTKRRRLSKSVTDDSYASTSDLVALQQRLSNLEEKLDKHVNVDQCQNRSSNSDLVFSSESNVCRLEESHVQELLAMLPSQRDCEVVLEYLIQEADWLIPYLDAQWILDIWSRFVYGGCITRSESFVIVAAVALGICLLEEGHHIYYPTTTPLGPIQPILMEYIRQDLAEKEIASTSSKSDIISELLSLALTNDCLPFQGHRRRDLWPQTRQHLYQWQQSINLLDESSSFWQGLDEVETERMRRLSWHYIRFERWLSIYGDVASDNPFRRGTFQLKRPLYDDAPLVAPFRADKERLGSVDTEPLPFRASTKEAPRLFRLKEPHEMEERSIWSELFIGLSSHCLAISEYIKSIEAWRQSAHAEKGQDHRREALLHQAKAICIDISRWKENNSILLSKFEADLDPKDYFSCRRASQSLVIHVGTRQLLHIVLSAWVTEYSIHRVDSPMLLELQKDAFNNARESVYSVGIIEKLLRCGTIIQTPWVAMSIFDAATILAIPLLAASRGSKEGDQQDYPHVVRLDQPLELSRIDTTRSERSELSKSSIKSRIRGALVDKAELSQFAKNIIQLLRLLTQFKSGLLGVEAKKRLAELIRTFGEMQEGIAFESVQDDTMLSEDTHWSEVNTSAASNSGSNILDSLFALDDDWWNEMLLWNQN